MNVLIVTTPSHLHEQYFLPTLPPVTQILEKTLGGNHAGNYDRAKQG